MRQRAGSGPLWVRAVWLALITACGDATPVATVPPPPPTRLVAEELGRPLRPGATLTLEAAVLDQAGTGVEGVRVVWRAENGTVSAAGTTSDRSGAVRTAFAAGRIAGPARVVATVPGLDSAGYEFEIRPEPTSAFPRDVFLPVQVPTYEGSGETVHPDHALAPFSLPEHLALTPYPGGRSDREQPSLFASASGLDWSLQPGAPNPVVPQPANGNLSDPDLVYEPDAGQLRLYYRHATASRNTIYLVRSADGLRWTAPEVVLAVPSHEAISPAVVRRGPGQWLMWVVNGGSTGCTAAATGVELRTSTDGVHWSGPEPVDLAADSLMPWHIDVQWIQSRNEYWALFNVKSSGTCTTPALLFAVSPDGLHWAVQDRPVATRGVIPEFRDVVYRSTFRFDPATDDVWLWISGARFRRKGWVWSTFEVRRDRRSLIEPVGPDLALTRAIPRPSTHRLVDWP